MESDQKRAFLAVVLSGAVLLLWQMFFAPKTIQAPNQARQEVASKFGQKGKATDLARGAVVKDSFDKNSIDQKSADVQEYHLENKIGSYQFTNDLTFLDARNIDAVFTFKSIVGSENPLSIQANLNGTYQNIPFEFTQEGQTSVRGSNTQFGINFRGHLEENGRFNFTISSNKALKFRLVFNSAEKTLENNQFRQFVTYTDEVDFNKVGDEEVGEGKIKWLGIDYNYHLFAFILKNNSFVKYNMQKSGVIVVELVEAVNELDAGVVFSKKNYDALKGLGDKLELAVDFGFFGILAVPLLRGLQFFYDFIPNYGLAIILLTLFIRTLMFPLQFKSFKSMKKMQNIQPELKKLKEKFKDDPQRMQKETMELFKRAGANPLGGCLPLVAQMPIFFAFYKVLYSAVELVGAPFVLWISDLSIKDPYYVLPVLMAATMLLQQKFQPSTTADPAQQKIMMIMPVVFGFIMKDLPAGLVLYIFVSTLYGIIQQLLVYKTTD